jgi:hypothetical protein
MTLSQEGIERGLVVLCELAFRSFPHDAVVSDDAGFVKRPLFD